jgi:hypothetical protein
MVMPFHYEYSELTLSLDFMKLDTVISTASHNPTAMFRSSGDFSFPTDVLLCRHNSSVSTKFSTKRWGGC